MTADRHYQVGQLHASQLDLMTDERTDRQTTAVCSEMAVMAVMTRVNVLTGWQARCVVSHERDDRGTVRGGTWSSQCLEPGDSECPTSCTDLAGHSGTRCYDCDDTVKPVCYDTSMYTLTLSPSLSPCLLFVISVNYCFLLPS